MFDRRTQIKVAFAPVEEHLRPIQEGLGKLLVAISDSCKLDFYWQRIDAETQNAAIASGDILIDQDLCSSGGYYCAVRQLARELMRLGHPAGESLDEACLRAMSSSIPGMTIEDQSAAVVGAVPLAA